MRRPSVIITVLAFLVFGLLATAPTLITPPSDSTLTVVEIPWTAVPTSTDDAVVGTVWLDYLAFSVAGTGRTVTLVDKQASPITFINAIALSANQLTVITLPSGGMRLQGGFTVVASGSGVVYQFRGKVVR